MELVWLAYVLAAISRWGERYDGKRRGERETDVTSWRGSQRRIGDALAVGLKQDGLGLRVKRRLTCYLKAEASWLGPLLNGRMKSGVLIPA
ncbi:MAG: hypothetical protein ACE5JP_14900 [Candidatus Bipolaricaulia bacterium]